MTSSPTQDHPFVLAGGQVLRPDGSLAPGVVEIADGAVVAVRDGSAAPSSGLPVRHLPEDRIVAPGLIDTHVHGRLGRNAMEATPEALDDLSRHLLDGGVTSFVAGTASVGWDRLLGSLDGLARQTARGTVGADLLGIHLEGPFLSAHRRGVHQEDNLVAPTPERVDAVLEAADGRLRICTLAPELPGADAAIRRLDAAGVRVSAGHTDATYEQAVEAIDSGVRGATHLFNAMPPIHHRSPGPVLALTRDPRVWLELVADGVHVASSLVQVLLITPGLGDRIVLVSDGTDVAGLRDGPHRRWEGTEVEIRDGRAYTPAGGVAGSTATLLDGVRTAVAAGVPAARALDAATRAPADSLGLTDRGRIQPGARADLVVLDADLRIDTTILRGQPQGTTQR